MFARRGIVIQKQKFSTHGETKQTYMLFQNDIPIDVACHRYTLNMQVSSGTKNNSSRNEPSCTTVNGVIQWCSLGVNGYLVLSILKSGENKTTNKTWTRRKTSHKTTVVVSTMHALYSRLIAGDSELRNCQIPVLIRRCNSGATCPVTSTHITIILESFSKPGDDTLGDSKFLGYFQLSTSTFQLSNNSTT
ncbi:uncharacterized protein TNCV_1168491 [Trichonephila clavipes]|uniref:Uncharacterized protein n=1 Tax=Trichonephila clavipes TaxID=2585209 RepID=A0A8X6T2C1_TRICX|nr:uncharacterized protein TNCV_1168491 [Trichonephila clavipes]